MHQVYVFIHFCILNHVWPDVCFCIQVTESSTKLTLVWITQPGHPCVSRWVVMLCGWEAKACTACDYTNPRLLRLLPTRCSVKKNHFIFDYNFCISWSIFIILAPEETGMNAPQHHVIYLLICLMTS